MRSSHLLFSAVQFLFTILILLLGGFFIGLHYAPHLRFKISQFLIDHCNAFIPIGLSILGCGILLLIGFFTMNRSSYWHFIIPAKNAVVEAALFQSCVKKYWMDQFPENDLFTHVILHAGQKVEISLEMPPIEIKDHHAYLEKIENDLRGLLSNSLGYHHDFVLTVILK